jgi:hypothetical protein
MSRTLEGAASIPKLSFTNWILGGELVTIPRAARVPSGDADKDPRPKYNLINGSKVNETRYYQNRRVSKDKVNNTEKDAKKENNKNGGKAGTGKKPVPKDEIAKKEEVLPTLCLLPS